MTGNHAQRDGASRQFLERHVADDQRREVAGVQNAHGGTVGSDHQADHGREPSAHAVAVHDVVHALPEVAERCHVTDDRAHRGLEFRAQQGGAEALARHVGQHQRRPLVAEAQRIDQVAAHLVGRLRVEPEVPAVNGRRGRRHEGLLNGTPASNSSCATSLSRSSSASTSRIEGQADAREVEGEVLPPHFDVGEDEQPERQQQAAPRTELEHESLEQPPLAKEQPLPPPGPRQSFAVFLGEVELLEVGPRASRDLVRGEAGRVVEGPLHVADERGDDAAIRRGLAVGRVHAP